MSVALDVNQQQELLGAMLALDSYQQVSANGQTVRVPYRLGAVRKALAKNVNALKAALRSYDESRVEIVREVWPNLAEGADVKRIDDPENYDRFMIEVKKLIQERDHLDLVRLPETIIDQNEFPADALSVLYQFDMIEPAAG